MEHPHYRIGRGALRRLMRGNRKLREVTTAPAPDTTAAAREEVARIGVFDVAAGQRELSDLYSRAQRRG